MAFASHPSRSTRPTTDRGVNAYDSLAPAFNRRRPLPSGVPEQIRDTVFASAHTKAPRVLDLGAGSGRVAGPFLNAGDDYTAADLSLGMLGAFQRQHQSARLVQADATVLPFPDAAFDIVLLVQVLSGLHGWRRALPEIVRTIAPAGIVVVGRVVSPDDGVDAVLKAKLADILASLETFPYRDKPRDDAMGWLGSHLPTHAVHTIARWTTAERTPRAFIERHGSGARFSKIASETGKIAMARLEAWANERYGGLDAGEPEEHRFELSIYRKN